jgi:hypothetical protein
LSKLQITAVSLPQIEEVKAHVDERAAVVTVVVFSPNAELRGMTTLHCSRTRINRQDESVKSGAHGTMST